MLKTDAFARKNVYALARLSKLIVRIALIADAYPPMRSSAAVQLSDLSQELVRQGHLPTVMIPSDDLEKPWALEEMNGVQVLRLKSMKEIPGNMTPLFPKWLIPILI